MKNRSRGFLTVVLMTLGTPQAFASETTAVTFAQVQQMMQEMRSHYEAQITDLKNEIATVISKQEHFEEKRSESLKSIENQMKVVDNRYRDIESRVGRNEGGFESGGGIEVETGVGSITLGGYADIEFENFQNSKATFDQHRLVLSVGAMIHERLRFFSEFELEHGGPDASGSGESKVEQAWIDFLINDWVNFRAGALLVPFGRYNLYHDSQLQELTDRPLMIRRIIPTTWTESGAGLHGAFHPTIGDYEDLEITYEAYVINGINEMISDTGLRSARGSIGSDNNQEKSLVGRVTVSPKLGHEVGLSGYYGDFDNEGSALGGLGVDFFSKFGPLEILGEGALFFADDPPSGDTSDEIGGFYLQANYHLWPEILDGSFLKTGFENPQLTLVSRYGYVFFDDDSDGTTGENTAQRITLGINYRPIESWVLKLEYQINQRQNESVERGSGNGFIASIAMGF